MDIQEVSFQDSKSNAHVEKHSTAERLSRTQSYPVEPAEDRAPSDGQSILRRRSSLPMNSVQNIPVASYQARKPSFKIQLPTFRLGQRPSATATGVDHAFIGRRTSTGRQGQTLPTFVPAPLTPPDETSVIEFAANSASLVDLVERNHPQPSSSSASTLEQFLSPPLTGQMSIPALTFGEHSASDVNSDSSPFEPFVTRAVSSASTSTSTSSIKLVYQALPYPSTEDENATSATVFPALIEALQQNTSLGARYLHVVRALPERCPTHALPTSPPTTPGRAVHPATPQGYFDYRPIISNAVMMADRYLSRPQLSASIPPSPGFALPPGEATISLYERIIPPSTVQEALDFFEFFSPSSLTDRILELAPNGTLIVAYPTQAGGRAFESQYLGPLLEPVLRNLLNNHGISTDVGNALGNMAAVRYLKPFEEMKTKLKAFLSQMSRKESGDAKTPYSTPEAATVKVQVTRKMWEKWWIHQEKPRIDQQLLEYFSRGHARSSNSSVTAASLSRELIESLEKRGYAPGEQTGEGDGIEIGVFIVKRAL